MPWNASVWPERDLSVYRVFCFTYLQVQPDENAQLSLVEIEIHPTYTKLSNLAKLTRVFVLR